MTLANLAKDENNAHLLLLILSVVNLLLVLVIFLLVVPQSRQFLPKIIPISAQTPIIRFSLVSPAGNSTVSGNVPLVTTLTNGPRIISAQLLVDGQKAQAVTSQKTDKLTLYWDTAKHADSSHQITIEVRQDNGGNSTLTTTLNVQNNVSRNVEQR